MGVDIRVYGKGVGEEVREGNVYSSSMFGWNIRFTKPMLGDL